MKLVLILLFIISCGKHDEPASKDIRDSDGDQVLNHEESTIEKYIANIENIGAIKGSLKFKGNEFYSIPFSNDIDLKSKIPSMIVSNEKRIKFDEHFTEGAQLKVTKAENLKLNNLEYEVVFHPNKETTDVFELYYESETSSYKVADWDSVIKFKILGQDLKELTAGRAGLVLRRKFKKSDRFSEDPASTIRQKTYKLYFDDGKSTSIYYVSKELDFESFLKMKGISAKVMKSEDDFFFNMNSLLSKEWIAREFSNGDKALTFIDGQSITKMFLDKYTYRKTKVTRLDGIPHKGIQLNNKEGANIYLRINNIKQIKREFAEKRYEKKYGGHEETKYTCKHLERWISKEYEVAADFNTLIDNIEIFGSNTVTLHDESNYIWNLKVNYPTNAVIEFAPTLPESKRVIGLVSGPCGEKSGGPRKSDEEGILSFELESFVEKIR